MEDRSVYLEEIHNRLDNWESKVASLQEEARETRQLKAAMQQPVETTIEPLLEEFKSRVGELRTADEGNWAFMRERAEAAESQLANAFERVAEEFDVG